MGVGHMSNTAYDTAWIARIGDIAPNMSNAALSWLSKNQLSDGSWGAKDILYYHDRIICTLAAMIALTYRGKRMQDKVQIENGLIALGKITSQATHGLAGDLNGATVGFEVIVPTLVAEAEKLGVIKQQGDRILGRLSKMRQMKIAKLSGVKINRNLAAVLSSEMAGTDSIAFLDTENLQEANGSVGYSPASTAYFSLQIKPGDERAINYLKSIITNGGAPFVAPFDIFERCWVLWNFVLLENLAPEIIELIRPHLDFLEQRWIPGKGISFTTDCALIDSDDSSVTYQVLNCFGRHPDLGALFSYEEEKYFRCYQYEINPSIGANIHILGALKMAGYETDHPSVRKILIFLYKTRYNNAYWFDKWHASPYYITSHAIIECLGYDDKLCEDSVNWILDTQKPDGSWGFYGFSTAEETAFCLQALKVWRNSGRKIPANEIEIASGWLTEHCEPPYPWMWIGKTLYYPELLIQSIILTALAL